MIQCRVQKIKDRLRLILVCNEISANFREKKLM